MTRREHLKLSGPTGRKASVDVDIEALSPSASFKPPPKCREPCLRFRIVLGEGYGPDRSKPKWKMDFPRRDRGYNSVDPRINPIHCLCLLLRQLQQDVRLVGLPLVLLTWMWLSVFVVLFGAEINGEAERQTQQDTTADPH